MHPDHIQFPVFPGSPLPQRKEDKRKKERKGKLRSLICVAHILAWSMVDFPEASPLKKAASFHTRAPGRSPRPHLLSLTAFPPVIQKSRLPLTRAGSETPEQTPAFPSPLHERSEVFPGSHTLCFFSPDPIVESIR